MKEIVILIVPGLLIALILVGKNTSNIVTDFVCRKLDHARVKGKDKPVAIYEPTGGPLEQATCCPISARTLLRQIGMACLCFRPNDIRLTER